MISTLSMKQLLKSSSNCPRCSSCNAGRHFVCNREPTFGFLVLNSVGLELGFGSREHLLNNVSLDHKDFPVDGQPGQPPLPLHPSSLLPR